MLLLDHPCLTTISFEKYSTVNYDCGGAHRVMDPTHDLVLVGIIGSSIIGMD